MKKNNYIMRTVGTPAEICKKLYTLRAVFGGSATLSDIERATKAARLKAATRQQLSEISKEINGGGANV